jgi:hypothetical protein
MTFVCRFSFSGHFCSSCWHSNSPFHPHSTVLLFLSTFQLPLPSSFYTSALPVDIPTPLSILILHFCSSCQHSNSPFHPHSTVLLFLSTFQLPFPSSFYTYALPVDIPTPLSILILHFCSSYQHSNFPFHPHSTVLLFLSTFQLPFTSSFYSSDPCNISTAQRDTTRSHSNSYSTPLWKVKN